jgi:hypothetical protein
MYFNHVLKCPIDLKTKFGMEVHVSRMYLKISLSEIENKTLKN